MNVDATEINKFNTLAHKWWYKEGDFKTLHQINPLRVRFIKRCVGIELKKLKILDIGCGRANIISFLQKRYRFKNKAIGIDIIKNKNIKRNIIFKRLDAIKFLKKKKKLDLIIFNNLSDDFSDQITSITKKISKAKTKKIVVCEYDLEMSIKNGKFFDLRIN